jgi:hypothetical protein
LSVPWTCANCHEEVDDELDACWQCGTSAEGAIDPEFARRKDEVLHGPGPDSTERVASAEIRSGHSRSEGAAAPPSPVDKWLPRLSGALLVLCVGLTVYSYWRDHYGPTLRALQSNLEFKRACTPAFIAWVKAGVSSTSAESPSSLPAGSEGFVQALRRDRPSAISVDKLCESTTYVRLYEITNHSDEVVADIDIYPKDGAVWSDRTDQITMGETKIGDIGPGQTRRIVSVRVGFGSGLDDVLSSGLGAFQAFWPTEQLPIRFATVFVLGLVAVVCTLMLAWPRRTVRRGIVGWPRRLFQEPFGQLAIVAMAVLLVLLRGRLELLFSGAVAVCFVSGVILGAPMDSIQDASGRGVAFTMSLMAVLLLGYALPLYGASLVDNFTVYHDSIAELPGMLVVVPFMALLTAACSSLFTCLPALIGAWIGWALREAATAVWR